MWKDWCGQGLRADRMAIPYPRCWGAPGLRTPASPGRAMPGGRDASSGILVNPKFYPSGNICRARSKTQSSLSSQAWSRGDLVARHWRDRHF